MSLISDRLDGIQAGVAFKAPVRCATTANITLSGEQTIDGIAVSENGGGIAPDRVLVKNQTNTVENGIYNVSTSAWTRAKDFDGARDVVQGTRVPVYSGAANDGSTYQVTTTNPVRPGTSNITFEITQDVDLAADLADTTNAALGAGMVGHDGDLSYAAGTVGANLRKKLTGSRTYYVRTDGNDSNNGLTNSAGGAFLTLQKAVDTVKNKIDLNGYDVTIQVADGTYTAGLTLKGALVGQGNLYIFGNTTTPANCIVSATSSDCFRAEQGAAIDVRGFKCTTTTSGGCMVAYTGAFITTLAMEFGACAGSHFEAGTGSVILPSGDYSITGGGVSHFHVGSEGMIFCGTITITVTGSPAFSAYFAGCAEGSISFGSVTFSSTSATGSFFLAHKNGTIDIGANSVASFIPGDASGTLNTGGILATTNRDWTPVLTFSTPGDLSVAYSVQKGSWSRVGDVTIYTCDIQTSAFTHTTAAGALIVSGIPFSSKNVTNVNHLGATYWQGITKAGYTQVSAQLPANATAFSFPAFGSGQAVSSIAAADMPTGGTVVIRFSIAVLSATAD